MNKNKWSISNALGTLWPGMRYLGFGILNTWTYLANSGAIWISDIESNGINMSNLYLFTTASAAVLLLLAPFLRGRSQRVLDSRPALLCCGLVAMAGAFLVILAGPYYLTSRILSRAGYIMIGLASAVFTLRLGQLYSELRPRALLLNILLSELLCGLLFFFVLGNPLFYPVAGGPSFGGIAAFMLLPLAVAYVISLGPAPAASAAAPIGAVSAEDHPSTPLADRIMAAGPASRTAASQASGAQVPDAQASGRPVPNAQASALGASGAPALGAPALDAQASPMPMMPRSLFAKFFITIMVFSFSNSLIRSSFISLSPPSDTWVNSSMTTFFLMLLTVAVLLLAIRFLHRFTLGKLYLLLMVVLALLLGLIPFIQISNAPITIAVTVTARVFDYVVWLLLASVVRENRLSPLNVFGFGRGLFAVGGAIGCYIGVNFLPGIAEASLEPLFYGALAFLLLASTTLVFSEKDFDRLFPGKSDIGFEKAGVAGAVAGIETEPDGKADKAAEPHPWLSACRSVGLTAALSSREQEILELLSRGRTPEGIAQHLFLSKNTVRSHTHAIYNKLNIHSRQELVALVEAERDRRSAQGNAHSAQKGSEAPPPQVPPCSLTCMPHNAIDKPPVFRVPRLSLTLTPHCAPA